MTNWDNGVIDLNEALSRVLGRKAMYKKWLDDFFVIQTIDMVEIAFNERDYEVAHKAIHKLKGTSANLAIVELSAKARVLDDKIKDRVSFADMQRDFNNLVESFYRARTMYLENSSVLEDT